jgi:NhaP-type Na+/H+ or K+/H+ antiporter
MLSAIEPLYAQPAAQAVAWALLQFVWQGAVIGLITAAALAALRRSAPDVRYVVGTIGLSLMLTMPVVTAVQAWRASESAAAAATVSMPSSEATDAGRTTAIEPAAFRSGCFTIR